MWWGGYEAMWWDWEGFASQEPDRERESPFDFDFDFLSLSSQPKKPAQFPKDLVNTFARLKTWSSILHTLSFCFTSLKKLWFTTLQCWDITVASQLSRGPHGLTQFSIISSQYPNWTNDMLVQNYYKILEVDYDAPEEAIRSNYIRLALKWHPDKKKNEDDATSRFQDINEAYQVLSSPARRREYDRKGIIHIQDNNVVDYLKRNKSLILTCNGLGIRYPIL